ncbi:MAG: hypothetical protein M5U32_16345 [Myxococcota bacterium]|nr:hypothetical protein [Myxococcota bacterium]
MEHDPVRVRLRLREVQIGAADRLDPLERAADAVRSGLDRHPEAAERIGPDRLPDLFLVAEVAIGRHRGHPEFLGERTQRHAGKAALREALRGDPAQGIAEALDLGVAEHARRHVR